MPTFTKKIPGKKIMEYIPTNHMFETLPCGQGSMLADQLNYVDKYLFTIHHQAITSC